MTVKVLRNDLQKFLTPFWVDRTRGENYNLDSIELLNPIIGSFNEVKPQYNRIGFYCDSTSGMCWYEFKLPSGRIIAVQYSNKHFNYILEDLSANEKPIPDEMWEMISTLIRKGYLDKSKKYQQEAYRRMLRESLIGCKKRGASMKKRIKERLDARK